MTDIRGDKSKRVRDMRPAGRSLAANKRTNPGLYPSEGAKGVAPPGRATPGPPKIRPTMKKRGKR
jgi:hypothetical protein